MPATDIFRIQLLMPAFVGNGLPAVFAVPAAYGDLTTSMLAIASIVTFRWERLGIAYMIPVLYVPVLFITHGIAAWLFLKHAEPVDAAVGALTVLPHT